MLTLINNFHNTEYRTRKTREELDAIVDRVQSGIPDLADAADKALVRKIRKALCGISNCKCSGITGERGR